MKKKLLPKDKKLLAWLEKGGRDGGKKDFMTILEKSAKPLSSHKRSSSKKDVKH